MNGSCEGCKWEVFVTWLKGPANVPVPDGCAKAPCLTCPRLIVFRDHYTPGPKPRPEAVPVTSGGPDKRA